MKHLILSSLIGGVAVAACAQPIAYEPFNYNVGELLCPLPAVAQRTSPEGNYWISGTNPTNVSDAAIVSGSLSYSGLATSSGNSMTNGSATTPSQQSNRFKFNTGVSNGTFYASFLMRVDSLGATFTGAPANQGIITAMGYYNAGGTFIQAGLLWIGNNGVDLTSYRLGTKKLAATPYSLVQWATNGAGASVDYPVGQTLFIVQSYTFNPGSDGDDDCQIWVNPDPSTFGSATPPPSSATALIDSADLAYIDRFNFRQTTPVQTPEAATLDELRVGTNWTDVTPPFVAVVPQPSLTIAQAGPTAVLSWPTNAVNYFLINNTNFALARTNWPAVTNAVSVNDTNYNVTVDLLPPIRFYSLIRTNQP